MSLEKNNSVIGIDQVIRERVEMSLSNCPAKDEVLRALRALFTLAKEAPTLDSGTLFQAYKDLLGDAVSQDNANIFWGWNIFGMVWPYSLWKAQEVQTQWAEPKFREAISSTFQEMEKQGLHKVSAALMWLHSYRFTKEAQPISLAHLCQVYTILGDPTYMTTQEILLYQLYLESKQG